MIRTTLILILGLSVIIGVLSFPRKVEGLYSAGKLISCMCDGSDYIRFHNGYVIHYSTAHEPADLLGRYEAKSDGSIEIYMTPLRKTEPEEILFTLASPRIGYAIASTPQQNDSCLLVRIPTSRNLADMINRQEVTQTTIPDDTKIVTAYYDSSIALLREEAKPIKKQNSATSQLIQRRVKP